VQWVDGQWRVHEAGAALLAQARGPLCVVACAGLYRTGKSFFLNALAGHLGAKAESGFRVGTTSEACTRGIDVCVPEPTDASSPSLSADDGGSDGGAARPTLVLLDSEGIASMAQDETYDAQIFSLALLLSSYFVLNSMGVIDEAAIDRLYLITQISKRICAAATPQHAADGGGGSGGGGGGGEEAELTELSRFFPPLLWLLRDFVLELSDASGAPLSAARSAFPPERA
jgi:hypothetical protein